MGNNYMKRLHNIISNKQLKSLMIKDNTKRYTISFYKYFTILDPYKFRDNLYKELINLKVLGRIYVACEGINAQISVPVNLYQKMIYCIYNFHENLNNIRMNLAIENNNYSFWVLRFKVRKKILSDGINEVNFNYLNIGKYLKAYEVNTMIHDSNVIFADMRNDYEYAIGRFINAVQIPANTFREQLPKALEILKNYKNNKIVMYCTGGIRCEKATAWMHHHGFKYMYQIEGGIIEYVRQAREHHLPVYFKGKLFTFDERMGEQISSEILSKCYQCQKLSNNYVNCKNDLCHLLFIQCNECAKQYHGCCSVQCIK